MIDGVALREMEDELDWRENAGRPSMDAVEVAVVLAAVGMLLAALAGARGYAVW
jgi:hypothetical protein